MNKYFQQHLNDPGCWADVDWSQSNCTDISDTSIFKSVWKQCFVVNVCTSGHIQDILQLWILSDSDLATDQTGDKIDVIVWNNVFICACVFHICMRITSIRDPASPGLLSQEKCLHSLAKGPKLKTICIHTLCKAGYGMPSKIHMQCIAIPTLSSPTYAWRVNPPGCTLHDVYFVKYDVTVSFLAQVLDTVTYLVSQVLDTAS